MVYEVLAPVSEQRPQTVQAAQPLADLAGKRIGFVWDQLFDGDLVFAAIGRELGGRIAGMEFVGHEEFGDIHGADERQVVAELPEKLVKHRIDAVVAGVGA